MTLNYSEYLEPNLNEFPELYELIFSSDLISTSGSAAFENPTLNIFSSRIHPKKYDIYKLLESLYRTIDFPKSLKNEIFEQVKENIANLSNQDVKTVSNQIIELLEKWIVPFVNFNLPKFHSIIRDEGSFLIIWNFKHYKVGISIELNVSESNWYFVSDENYGYFSASGDTQNKNFNSILEWLIPFVITKSIDE